jgi:hypothetical protein
LVEGTPGGTTFSIPARLRFTLTENLVQPGGAFSVFIVNPSTGAYDPSEFVATVDPSGLTATAEITHFTQFAVSASPQSVRLSAVTPSSAAIGATVTISGSGFSSTPSANGVFFMKPGGRLAAATVSSATPTALNVVVPSGTTTGNLFVQVGSVRSNNLVFRVLSAANQPPAVDAGPNQTVALPEGLALSGIVFDDGLPNGAVVTGLWSQISGPGLVSFVNPSAFNTAASFSAEGSYTLRLTVNDTASSATGDVVVTVQPPPVANQAPAVNAGPDLTVSFPSSATLGGTVTDDGLPNGTLTTVWSKISGPGTVTFANANAASTTAGFSATGTYVLRLSGGDSVLTATDDVTVVVSSSPSSSNQAPTANAGADQSILQPVLAFLSGAVADDGLPFSSPPTASWSKISGPGVVTFGNSAQVPTTARFSLPGTYVLRLTASDGLLTGSDDVTITVVALTSCSNPVSGVVTIDVNATDDVGVAGVQVQLDGVDAGPELLISPYSMQWTTTGTPNGCHVITAIARDAAGNIGTSQLIVQVNNP